MAGSAGRRPGGITMFRLLATFLLLVPTVALAHPGHGGGFAAGVMHPLLGLDHLLAMIGIGVWAARREIAAAGLLGLTFLAVLVAAFVIGTGTSPQAWAEFGILGSLLVVGLLLVLGQRLPLMPGLLLAGLFAVGHGHAHGTEMASGLSAFTFGSGFVLASALLLIAGFVAGRWFSQLSPGRALERAAGGVIVATAAYLLLMV